MANAIIDVTKNGLSQYRAAQKYDIPQQSISDRLKGQVALADQIQPRQLLSKSQEARLVSWILRQESLGYAPSHSQIRACVEALMKQLNNERTVGRNWVSKFINRHPDIKNKRGDVRKLTDLMLLRLVRFTGLDSLVVGSADPKRKALLKGPQSRNWTSFIEAITADGRGKELQKQWFLTEFGKIADWHYITSPNGWTDNHIAIEWLERSICPRRDQPMPQMLD
ncbi:tc5 transposase DNA-binding domain-containing protein [Hirsutella rhossiliensis]|uniref:Tc5 transposase DNA-binding domain-containing protein n=1 Tax=Hirsutella rhossiliensis TaxID=111463 RepID=A0A9P8MWX5_9HYPO|nr:tc5 transposase DNA-binding domain-containing protein [Hirsutella rhossiliensis]KAH0962527.1 tc5 transposase DNA-binding domain-containing protein [Hirsutella rhossiliensis]